MIELYGGGSPNAMKVVILLEELGLPYEMINLKVMRGEQFSPEFLAMNPIGKYPVIVDRGGEDPNQPIFESGAILIYLAETYGDGTLLPARGPARYEVLKWLVAQVAWVGPMFGQNVHFSILPSEAEGYAATRYRNQVRHVCKVLDGRLAEAEWLAGDSYSIADIATWPWVGYIPRLKHDWADYPALKAWHERIAARPALARAGKSLAEIAAQKVRPRNEEDMNLFFNRTSGPKIDYTAIGVDMAPE